VDNPVVAVVGSGVRHRRRVKALAVVVGTAAFANLAVVPMDVGGKAFAVALAMGEAPLEVLDAARDFDVPRRRVQPFVGRELPTSEPRGHCREPPLEDLEPSCWPGRVAAVAAALAAGRVRSPQAEARGEVGAALLQARALLGRQVFRRELGVDVLQPQRALGDPRATRACDRAAAVLEPPPSPQRRLDLGGRCPGLEAAVPGWRPLSPSPCASRASLRRERRWICFSRLATRAAFFVLEFGFMLEFVFILLMRQSACELAEGMGQHGMDIQASEALALYC
jgi:hypothetical protein